MSDPVPDRIGPYQIIRLLGLGGMAQVYHARKSVEGVDLVVALKVPRQHVVMDQDARDRFLKEARITARLGSHPNIVQVLDVGVDGKLPYMALEYVTGVDLGQLCAAMIKAHTRWSEPAMLWVLASILQGLRHAWGAEVAGQPLRIVHRDISPSNILLTHEGQVKVTDFGISHMAGLETSGSIRGKARYMPYEQIMGRASAASDLYAVGAIAWELIEGKPFRHDKLTRDEMYLATMDGEMPEITREDVSPRLVQLVRALLHPQEQQRLQTPMDAWLELKACPGLNLVDPDPVRVLLEEFLGERRRSGYTAVDIRIHPELVATRAALAAAAAEQPVAPAPSPTIDPVMPSPPEPTVKWPYPDPRAFGAGPAFVTRSGSTVRPPISAVHAVPLRPEPRPEPRRGPRALGLAGAGLLLGLGVALAVMMLVEPRSPVSPTEARPTAELGTASTPTEVSAAGDDPGALAAASRPSSVVAPAPAASPAPAAPPDPAATPPAPAAPLDPAATSDPAAIAAQDASSSGGPEAEPDESPLIAQPREAPPKPKPKPAPRATVHVRLDLVSELELRIGSTVRRVTGSVTIPIRTSTREISIRTPGSSTWHSAPVRLEPGREYLLRLHAKRFELIALGGTPR